MRGPAVAKVRDLNDAFRRSFCGGRILLTAAVAARPPEVQAELLAQVRSFSAFSADNDPHGEHDFGVIDLEGESYFWKIDYYDLSCIFGSPDPADPAVTTRVLTVMRAEDY